MAKKAVAKVVKTKEFKSSSRPKKSSSPNPQLHSRVHMDSSLQLGPDAIELINRVSSKIKSDQDTGIIFIMGKVNSVHASLAVSGAPVTPGIGPAGSGERLLEYLDTQANSVANFISKKLLDVQSLAYHNLDTEQAFGILRKWRNVTWITNIRSEDTSTRGVGKVLVLVGSSEGVEVFEETDVFC